MPTMRWAALALAAFLALAPGGANACHFVHFLSAASNNAQTFTASANAPMGVCGALAITNTTATTALDFRFYDVVEAPNCASATGVVANVAVPVATTPANVASIVIPITERFTNGIGVCLTGAVADNDNTNAVTGVQVSFGVDP